VTYSRFGTLRARPGQREKVIAILLGAVDGLPSAGCRHYVVSTGQDPDLIQVSELWESAQHHRASLQLPATRAAIATAMPLLTGEFTSVEGDVVGGLGT
jgi:quinol monooxygenase YgiN